MIYVTVVVLFALVLGTFRAGFVHSLRMGYQVTLPVATVVYYGLLVLYGGLAQLLMLENYQRYIEQIWPYRPVIFLVLLYFLVISAVGIVAVLFMRDEPPGRATHRRRVAWAAEWYQRHGVYTILPWLGTAIVLVYLLIVVSQFEGVATDLHDMTYAVLIVGFLQALATMLMGRAERIAVVTGHTTTLQELADEYASTVAEIVDYNLIHRNSTVFNSTGCRCAGLA